VSRFPQGAKVGERSLSFGEYLASRRYVYSNLSSQSWSFLSFALGRPEYLRVCDWTELKALNDGAELDPDLLHGAFRLWQSYLSMKKRRASAAAPSSSYK